MSSKHNGKDESESIIKFPCEFVVKIMGKSEGDFEKEALAIIKNHFQNVDLVQIEKRHSKDKNYLSLSVTVYAQSKEQLDALYQDLSDCETVLMTL